MKKYAAIDVGLKRIGLATSFVKTIITPQAPILRKNRNQASSDVDSFLSQWGIDILVVGYPSSSEDMQKRIQYFVKLLKFEGEVFFCEENMSSVEAEDKIKGIINYKRDGRIDSISAMIILERFLLKRK